MERVKFSRVIFQAVAAFFSFIIVFLYINSFSSKSKFSCENSLKDSFGFFCINDFEWSLKKKIFDDQEQKQISTDLDSELPKRLRIWWQRNYEPNFSCPFEVRIGNQGDGGKYSSGSNIQTNP